MSRITDYNSQLRELQIGLVRHQIWAMAEGAKALVILEGRDGAGKDGAIARITEHLAPRNTRVVSLPKPSDREHSEWYFQRYVRWLPAAGELVIFNRSWYNRAGVEPVMGFCTPAEHEQFLREVAGFEAMVQGAGIKLVKIWLDITKHEQASRLRARQEDPIKRLKISDLDTVAQRKWKAYSTARNEMLSRTHTDLTPWNCVRANHKRATRLNVIRLLLQTLSPVEIRTDFAPPDPSVAFPFETTALVDGRLAK